MTYRPSSAASSATASPRTGRQEFHFSDWTPILDFIHLLTYLFTAARAARPKGPSAWSLYVRNNLARMDYPHYRARGLPVTTCFIESLVKRFNRRVKASDKFWVQPSLEAVLQVRAACLSEDRRWEKFWLTRSRPLAAASRPYRARAS